jgi:ABC-2 type transport system permease protein
MKTAWIIAIKDMLESFRNKAIYFNIAIMIFLPFPYLDILRNTLAGLQEQHTGTAALVSASQSFLGNALYALPLTLTMLFCTYLSAYAIVLEKAKRTLESLLATPASLRKIWLGKSLAVALPSIVVTYFVLLLTVVMLNILIIIPRVGYFVFPGFLPVLVSLFVVPLVALSVVCIVSILQLTMNNPRFANMIFLFVFIGFYFLTMAGFSSTWDFSLIYITILAVLVLVALVLLRFLTKDRVVLSSKGGLG